MSYAFHSNKSYGEQEPIYNTIYRRFAKGEIDLNLQDTLTYIKRVEAIPDNEYREIFRSYAEALHGKGPEAEKLLDAIVERKVTLRETYRSFYADLLTERTGKKQVFIWADEVQAHVKQPLAAVTHSPDVLKQMNMAELKQLAKQKAIPYYNNFSKPQLVQAISDPVKAVEISAQTKARLALHVVAGQVRLAELVVVAAGLADRADGENAGGHEVARIGEVGHGHIGEVVVGPPALGNLRLETGGGASRIHTHCVLLLSLIKPHSRP